MKPLQLSDLSREELLAWIERDVLPRWPFGGLVHQRHLLAIRHDSLRQAAQTASAKYHKAIEDELRAWKAWHQDKGSARDRNAAERVYLDYKAKADRARSAEGRANAAADTCWEALEAAWAAEAA